MLIWIAFVVVILLLLALDLGVFHRTPHVVSTREAVRWSLVWFAMAMVFAVFVHLAYDNRWFGLGGETDPTIKFLTGYIVELSLSIDNVFVIAMLFGFFGVPRQYQHRVLFWGILGALMMRGAMIAVGATLVARFSWILYVFGAILIVTAGKMVLMDAANQHPERNVIVRLLRRFLPVTSDYRAEHFWVTEGGRLMLTPLALVLVMVETTDLIFAVDSIPAIFAITVDPFLVFTSNVFAILGLRSLYFALAGALHMFRYLKHALAAVLLTVGLKMLAHTWLEDTLGEHFNLYLLAAILAILTTGVLASMRDDRVKRAAASRT